MEVDQTSVKVDLFFRASGLLTPKYTDSVKMCVGSGWVYVCSACKEEPPKQILAVRVTFFSLMEALVHVLSQNSVRFIHWSLLNGNTEVTG